MAIESQGTTITFNAAAIGEVVSIGGPSGSAPVIDISHLTSTGAEKLMGLLNEGQVAIECNFKASDVGQIACKTARTARTAEAVVVTLSDANTISFSAFCTGFSISGGVNSAVKLTITLEVSGAATYTEA